MTTETRELLADIRHALAWNLDGEASFRERAADEYPEDRRNLRSCHALRRLADELRITDIYDDTPALRKLLGLVTEHELNLDFIMPTEFDASKFRFYNAGESDDDFLSSLAEALEAELTETAA